MEKDGHDKSFHLYGWMVMGSHQKPMFDDCLWPSFSFSLKMMVMGSHRKPVFDDYLWPSFSFALKMMVMSSHQKMGSWLPMTIISLYIRRMVMGCHQTRVFDDCPWPSFHIYGKNYHDHDFPNFLNIWPFFEQNFVFWHLLRVWYTC